MMQQHTGVKQFSGFIIQSKVKNQADKTLRKSVIASPTFPLMPDDHFIVLLAVLKFSYSARCEANPKPRE